MKNILFLTTNYYLQVVNLYKLNNEVIEYIAFFLLLKLNFVYIFNFYKIFDN